MRLELLDTLTALHGRLVDERVRPPDASARKWGAHLAVPVIGNDEVVGVLFVSSAAQDSHPGVYAEQHLRELSIVGAHLGAYLVMVDQTRELDGARREAESANRMKDEFLALVSHQLKTPLKSVLAWTRTLRSEESSPSGRARALDGIERTVEAQTGLIDELLDLACIAAANLRLELKAVEPAPLIKAAVEGQRLRAERKSIRLETVLDESVDQVVVDPVRVVQVVATLLANAIRVTPTGSYVGVRLGRVGSHARIQVIDQGRGLSAQALPRAFEGVRSHKDPSISAGGELEDGLAMVKTVVAAHGGRVRVESMGEDRGTTFSVDLPLSTDAPGEGEVARVLAGVRVLVVDDDDDMRSAVEAVLELYGAEVTAVASAAAALAALERSKPHVLLSDISMPGESGYDLIREVAERDPELPAAALTACVLPEDRVRALAAGFRMHLAKPFDARALVTAVASLSGRALDERLEAVVTQ